MQEPQKYFPLFLGNFFHILFVLCDYGKLLFNTMRINIAVSYAVMQLLTLSQDT
jgi:hypothetical protein